MQNIKYSQMTNPPVSLHILGQGLANQLHSEAREMFTRFKQVQKLAKACNVRIAEGKGDDNGDDIDLILHQCHMVLAEAKEVV